MIEIEDRRTDSVTNQVSNQKGTTSSINVGRNERRFSVAGGAVLLVAALMRPKKLGLVLGPVAANLLYRGLMGHSLVYRLLGKNRAVHDTRAAISVPHEQGIRVRHSITIGRPVGEVYAFWRDFSNLPRFMRHLESIDVQGKTRSHWRVKGPAGSSIEWDAEIVNEEPDRVIGWRSLENPYVDHAGSVRFSTAPNAQGTEIDVEMEYAPLAGHLGAAVAALFGESPERQVWDDLHRLKQYLEVGEIATTEGQPSGRL